jgi:hypothetical protein
VDDSDIIIIGTNWAEYGELKAVSDEGGLAGKTVFDSKRLFRKGDLAATDYVTIG